MSRPRKNSKPLTELEKLQKENLELKTEIALLKKVRALVEERNARLREIGRKPSKD
jgi:cell division protein FtsB